MKRYKSDTLLEMSEYCNVLSPQARCHTIVKEYDYWPNAFENGSLNGWLQLSVHWVVNYEWMNLHFGLDEKKWK